ncbi:MAG TPA: relaxase domain-containing protein, partial [Actinomycetes bacterium]
MLGGGASAAAYYLDRSAECDLAGYYTGQVDRPGRWCGRGATALRLAGPLTGGSASILAGLLDGRLPD